LALALEDVEQTLAAADPQRKRHHRQKQAMPRRRRINRAHWPPLPREEIVIEWPTRLRVLRGLKHQIGEEPRNGSTSSRRSSGNRDARPNCLPSCAGEWCKRRRRSG